MNGRSRMASPASPARRCRIRSIEETLSVKAAPDAVPWIGFTGDLAPAHSAAIVHDFSELAKAALDIVVDKIQQSEFGLPKSPMLLRIAGKWVENGLRHRR